MKIGSFVEYYSVKGDRMPIHAGRIIDIENGGIFSNGQKMFRLDGKAGLVLASHCLEVF